ncbi:MAG: 23S rRNA pseudouridine(1911/1915/1917) synthase RluD [Azoarcus sp.]|nr:23S rRNA pseudouridine(1911/1915/1917) synthase RluD [Azoarcus sp.]
MNLVIENTRLNEPTDYSPDGRMHSAGVASSVTGVIPPECAGLRLDQALARLFPGYSRSRLQSWLREGRIRVDGRSPEARARIWGGERLEMDAAPPQPMELAGAAEDIALSIVFEDEDLLVIDKPAGLVVHPGNGNWSGTLMNALLHHAPSLAGVPRAGIVHRLDKDTSGLLAVAKTLAAQTHLIRQLQARTVGRHYLALVHGALVRDGEIDAPIARHPGQRTKMAVVEGGRPALTRYTVRERLETLTLLECRLATGRTHQIRVHMAHLGHPLAGDPVYGPRRAPEAALAGLARQALHAFRLKLIHPASGEAMAWFAPPPADLAALLRALGSRADEEIAAWAMEGGQE